MIHGPVRFQPGGSPAPPAAAGGGGTEIPCRPPQRGRPPPPATRPPQRRAGGSHGAIEGWAGRRDRRLLPRGASPICVRRRPAGGRTDGEACKRPARRRRGAGCPFGGSAGKARGRASARISRSEEHTSELQSPCKLVCRFLLEKKNI